MAFNALSQHSCNPQIPQEIIIEFARLQSAMGDRFMVYNPVSVVKNDKLAPV